MRYLVVSLLMVSVRIIEIQSNARCKYYIISKKMTRDDAKKHCKEKYTDLATFEDDDIDDCFEFEKVDNNCIWTNKRDQSGNQNNRNRNFKGQSKRQTRSDYCKEEMCKLWDGGQITNCDKEKAFVCYMKESAVPLILIRENKTWTEALHHCRTHHYDLVSIHNSDIQKWVAEKAKMADSPYVWLGLRYTYTLGFWFWVRDQLFCYQHWAPGNGTGGCKMSGAMEKGGEHRWFSLSDTQRLNFICSWSDIPDRTCTET